MYLEIPQGSSIEIQGLICHLPPEGYVYNNLTKQVEHRGVYSRSDNPEEQYWVRFQYPDWYKEVTKKEDDYLKKKKEDDPPFYDARYEEYKAQEWDRRLNGYWFMNKGKAVYLTGFYYMLLQWFNIDVGYAKFTIPHLKKTYFLQYCIEDPLCMGMIDVTKRRFLKTFMGGLFVLEYTTRTKMVNGALQSKKGNDAKAVFAKAIVYPFRKFPRFFRPEYDMSLGINPKTEIRFQQTNIRGKKAEDSIDKDELGSMIDWGSADPLHYDGHKIHRYFSDEWGKCFGKGTRIRMYDGSVKEVQNIRDGELVMGNDSTARITYGSISGKEEMFRITPKKGPYWDCNISHILSLKWCLNKDNKKRGWAAKSVVNMPVGEFLKLKPHEQKHLMLYKVPVEYTEQVHELDPYFLGLWLGDGSKHNPEITTADTEVISYLKELAGIEGLEFSNPEHIQYRLACKMGNEVSGIVDGVEYNFKSCRQASDYFGYKGNFTKTDVYKNNDWGIKVGQKNRLLTAMQNYNLIGNKHIPNEFLIDCRKNRLQLLAGLVDSDGHISKGPSGKPKAIEITQKIKHLAYQINELATSLGFYSSVIPKIATMRRVDKSLYECPVFKVMIYGDLWEIPMKVGRKKVEKINFHVNRRTSAHCGFQIKSIGVGEYYGFAVDGNHLFLLEDGTVVHNTTEANVFDRHEVVRYCMLDEEGNIIGKALYSTTVEKLDSDKDGVQDAARQLWDASDQNNREENGRTPSGLYRYFQTADESKNFDIYGYPDIEKTVREILADREAARNNPRSLSGRIRKEPRTIEEAFSEDGDKCIFNIINILEREKELREKPVFKRQILFEMDVETQRVKWRDIRKGEEEFCWHLSEDAQLGNFEDNKVIREGLTVKPGRTKFGAISVDSYSNSQGGRKYGSKASAWIGRKKEIDKPTQSNKAVGHLYGRPPEKDDLHRQIMLASIFYGYQVWFEHNSDSYDSYFRDRGKRAYLGTYPLSCIEPLKKETTIRHRGVPTTPYSLTVQHDNGIAYFENYCHLIDFDDLLTPAKKFDPYDRTKFDSVVSFLILITVLNEPVHIPKPLPKPIIQVFPQGYVLPNN